MTTIFVVDPDGTGDYSSLSAAIGAIPSPLNDDYIISCISSGGTADTTAVIINKTYSGHTLTIQAGSNNRTLKTGWVTSRYRLSVTDTIPLIIAGSNVAVLVDGIQIEMVPSTVSDDGVDITAASGTIDFANCRIRQTALLDPTWQIGVKIGYVSPTVRLWNTIITGFAHTNGAGVYAAQGSISLYNCIVHNCYRGVYGDGASATVINSAVFNTEDDFIGTISIDHCASDDGDGTNPVAPSGGNWANEFVNAAGSDFTLINTGNLYHGGADNPGSGLYSTDIEGDAYNSGAFSIGVDEYSAGGTTYTVLCSDSIALNDIDSAAAAFAAIAADGIAIDDSNQRTAIFQVVAVDGIALEDITLKTFEINAIAADGITITDIATALADYLSHAIDGIMIDDISIGLTDEATGIVTISMSTKKGTVTFTIKKPAATFVAKKSEVSMN